MKLPAALDTIGEIQIDQRLIRNARRCGHLFKIFNNAAVEINGDLLPELFCVRVFLCV